jgi:Glycosyl transferase family 2
MEHQFVVLAYGASPYLSACLDSLLAQTVKSPIVIATSTPCEHITRVASQHDVSICINPVSSGIAADWNFGLACGTESLVTLAHQDDLYYPEFAATIQQLFQQAPDASLAFTDYDEVSEGGERLRTGRVLMVKRFLLALSVGGREVVKSRLRRRSLLAYGNVIPCPSVTFNKRVVGDFRFSEHFAINLDWEAWWRMHAWEHPFVQSRQRLLGHRLHRNAETSLSKDDGRRWDEDRAMFQRIWPLPFARIMANLYRLGY